MRNLSFLLVVLAACGGSGSGDDDPDAPPGNNPDGAAPDGPAPGDGGGDPPPDSGVPVCGTAQPDLKDIKGTEGIAIAADGTIYYCQREAIGRLTPQGDNNAAWATLKGATTVWGLALTDEYLFAGSPTTDSIWRVALKDASVKEWLPSAGEPNGVIIGADGALYYSHHVDNGVVYRVDPKREPATREAVTIDAPSAGDVIAKPNGLYSIDDKHLIVLSYSQGKVWELTLNNGKEVSRTSRKTITGGMGSGTLDGITRDGDGRWYITDQKHRRVVRVSSDFLSAPQDIGSTVTSPANLEFGRGALSCSDLYVTSGGVMQRIAVPD